MVQQGPEIGVVNNSYYIKSEFIKSKKVKINTL